MKMRKVMSLIIVLLILMSVPVNAATKVKVADWHTDQFRKMYAKMQENDEVWETLDPAVKKEIKNYAEADRQQAEAILILRSIDLEVYVKKVTGDEDDLIGKFVDIFTSKEFQSYAVLTGLAKNDGLVVRKNAKGIYSIYTIDIPEQ